MSKQPLLAILIPTYNRENELSSLLATLQKEVGGSSEITVFVSDNASTDGTRLVLEKARSNWPELQWHRHGQNLGPDANFLSCVKGSNASYFWLLGDDDQPRAGAIESLCSILKSERPDLVYLQSKWQPQLPSHDLHSRLEAPTVSRINNVHFSRKVGTWLTYISGLVVSREKFQGSTNEEQLQSLLGTNLVQLGWVLPVLRDGQNFICLESDCVFATSGNTGGYRALTVFGANYPRIAKSYLAAKPEILSILMRYHLTRYFPSLVWQVRFGKLGVFHSENPWPAIKAELGGFAWFWLVLLPIGNLPKWLAYPFYIANRVLLAAQRRLLGAQH